MTTGNDAIPTADRRHFTVVGAGTVGVCCALYLQRDGHRVTLVDRQEPGRGCSYGNAGLIQVGACVPVATPGVLARVPKMLMDPKGPLVVRWPYLPRLAPYLMRFVAASLPHRVEAISIALMSMLEGAVDAFKVLLDAASASDMLWRSGELYVYKSEASYAGARFAFELRRRRGVRVEDVPIEEVRQLEPALAPVIARAVYLPDVLCAANPYLLTKRLAEDFVAKGGEVRQEAVTDIEVAGEAIGLVTDAGRLEVDRLVLATGAWSKPWAAKLGARVPLDTERGYHVTLPDPGVKLRVSVVSGDHRFGIASMVDGMRLAGTAELASLNAPPDYRRADMLIPMAKELIPDLNTDGGERWMGHRPSTPDSLPVIGRSPRHSAVYFAFGHGHLGLTLGAVTGKLIADLAARRPIDIDIAPFDVGRFG